MTNIHLEFLPPNTTSMIQPMDQGVIRNLKVNYRKQLISLTLSHIEEGLLLPTAKATDVSSKVNVFDAIQFVSKSWRLVLPATISNCFRKAGFQKRNALLPTGEATDTAETETDETEEEEAEAFLAMQGEADTACRGGEATEEEIVEAVQEKKRQRLDGGECAVDEEEGQEEEEEEEDDRHVSAADAKKALATLCRFATASGFTPETLQKLDDVGAAVHKAALASMVQPDITRFFHSQPTCSTSR